MKEKYNNESVKELGEELIKWMLEDEKNLFFDRFIVIEKRLNKSTLCYLKKKFEFFSEYLDTAKEIQRIKLQEGAIFKKLDSRITQLMLSCHHDVKEQTPEPSSENKKTLHLHIR